MQLPPGLVALVRILPRLLFAPATVHIGLEVYKALVGEPVPQWLRIPAYLLVLPGMFAANILYTRARDRGEAARCGAVMPPTIHHTWPGALDKLSRVVWNFSNGYQGRFIVLSTLLRHDALTESLR